MGPDGLPLKIPHLGWNFLIESENATWNGTILQNLTPGDAVYLLHSFMVEPENPAVQISDCL